MFFLEYYMGTNNVFNQFHMETNTQSKWWHHRWVKIIGISFIILIILTISLSLLLEFAILTPKQSYTTTTTTTQPPGEFQYSISKTPPMLTLKEQ
jgi:hypothetical protein